MGIWNFNEQNTLNLGKNVSFEVLCLSKLNDIICIV